MPRYIAEYKFDIKGGIISIPTCAKFLSVEKVTNYFILVVEVWGNPELLYDIELLIRSEGEYIFPEAVYIDNVLVGSHIHHFFYRKIDEDFVDEGSGGGSSPTEPSDTKPEPKMGGPIRPAGGMKEC